MEIAIGAGIGIIIAALFGKKKSGKKHSKTMPYDPSKANTPQETAEERKRRETDELITTVLPTVNSGK